MNRGRVSTAPGIVNHRRLAPLHHGDDPRGRDRPSGSAGIPEAPGPDPQVVTRLDPPKHLLRR